VGGGGSGPREGEVRDQGGRGRRMVLGGEGRRCGREEEDCQPVTFTSFPETRLVFRINDHTLRTCSSSALPILCGHGMAIMKTASAGCER
jgi:hypothetical protein